jgi:uncharacterized damage-inducible protein DinB
MFVVNELFGLRLQSAVKSLDGGGEMGEHPASRIRGRSATSGFTSRGYRSTVEVLMSKLDDVLSDFDRLHAELIKTVRECPDDKWEERTAPEGWAVGVVARHIALGYLQGRAWIRTMAAGEPVTMKTDDIHAANAENAGRRPDPKSETEAFLEKAYERWVATVRGFSDEDLQRAVHFGPRETDARVEDIVALTPRHTRGHLDSIKATLAGAAV